MNAHIKRRERSQINNLMLHLRLLEKAEPKTSRREIIKMRAKINEIETKKIQRINKTKSLFCEKINKIDKTLSYLTKMSREKTQISKIRNKKGAITINTKEIRGIIKDYFENLYSNEWENHEEKDKFLDTHDHLNLNQEDLNHLKRSITCNEIEAAIVSQKRKVQGPMDSPLNSTRP
jgi:hypothetical protein